jgi:protein-S-isoprenylcysteine O-methyltransferase Ste14
MQTVRAAIGIVWIVFWLYWLVAALDSKKGTHGWRRIPLNGATAVCVFLLLRVFRGGSLVVNSVLLGTIGAILLACGLAVAVWARVYIGRNWGMPMTQKEEPELVTSGPYRFVRHPIYSGLLVGILGTALATDLLGLIVAVILGGYFYYAASVEEKNLSATFPTAYPAYRSSTKMLIPFVL